MGYYTEFDLEILEGHDFKTDYTEEICEFVGYDNCFGNDIKWYSHENDMVRYSKKHPNVVFELSGKGEDHGDVWKKYFKNGKIQVCHATIIYEEYNEGLLE